MGLKELLEQLSEYDFGEEIDSEITRHIAQLEQAAANKWRYPFFAANNGKLSDQELEQSAVNNAVNSAGALIVGKIDVNTPIGSIEKDKFRELVSSICHSYTGAYYNYTPF